jgi:hypothetical protein
MKQHINIKTHKFNNFLVSDKKSMNKKFKLLRLNIKHNNRIQTMVVCLCMCTQLYFDIHLLVLMHKVVATNFEN